jgi:phage FluMu protein Com
LFIKNTGGFMLKDLRCIKCDKLLAKYNGIIEVKCPVCNEYTHSNPDVEYTEGKVWEEE